MLNDLENLYSLCFPNRKHKWAASDFAEIKKSGAEIIASKNAFMVYRCVADECELILIGVAPDYRRTGTATALMTLIEKESKKQSVKKIFLEVSSTNTPAINLYKKMGYNNIGIRKKYYEDGSDAIVMEKQI
ncbi:MAG: ribosomal protein S18-alanine N-acetyltransferase [Alphaproteobacteria bacterium]|nr:ribosomal protein S18-alanine N-acetyltransferase [Alphaproteobacteria bacterium]